MNTLKQQGATLVQRACAKVAGFKALHKRLEKKIIVSGKSQSTLTNSAAKALMIAPSDCLPSSAIRNYLSYSAAPK